MDHDDLSSLGGCVSLAGQGPHESLRPIPHGRGIGLDGPLMTQALEELRYISALMDNMRIEAQLDGTLASGEPVELGHVLELVLGRERLIARRQEVELAGSWPDEPVWVTSQVVMAQQALTNVVHNAVRYNEPGGHVAVVLEVLPEARFRLMVLDDGPGVPPEALERLVERQFRVEEARPRDGAGLGLYITSRICERWGWSLKLEATEPSGLKVTIEGDLNV